MEERKVKIIFNKSGAGNITPRVTLPATWIKQLGLNQDNREVKITFDNEKIIISKYQGD